MYQQLYIDRFRIDQMIQDKAWSAGNGQPFSKTATQNWIIWSDSLWASREVLVRCVTSLGKGQPLPAKRALRSTISRFAEPINIK